MSLTIDENDCVVTLSLVRPETKNGLNASLRLALRKAIDDAQHASVIVIRGAGGTFCSGQDLNEAIAHLEAGGIDAKRMLEEEYIPILTAIENSTPPVIALVEGIAAGAGFALALACDMVVAARSAEFHIAFAKVALVHDVGASYILPRLVGRARAMGMALLAEPVSATQAEEWGLIWKVVNDHELEGELARIASTLADYSRSSLLGLRQLTRASLDYGRDIILAHEAELQHEAMNSADFAEAVEAFTQKRKPKFR